MHACGVLAHLCFGVHSTLLPFGVLAHHRCADTPVCYAHPIFYSVKSSLAYISSFTCLLMSSIWFKVLTAIDQHNKILQARNATLDVEVKNVNSLLVDLQKLRSCWSSILSEVKLVAGEIGIPTELPSKRTVK